METKEELLEYKGFHVGDYFIIKRKPSTWNSLACKKSPLQFLDANKNLTYPYKGRIKKIIKKTEHYNFKFESIGMTEGKYGWSLQTLIEDELIFLDVKKQRLKKLEKLNKV